MLFLSTALILTGCENNTAVEIATTPAHERLKEILIEEKNVNAITRAFENSIWIYVPLENPFLEMSSSDKGPQKSSDMQEKLSLYYLDGQFDGQYFNVAFDVGQSRSYMNDRGLQNKYTEEYSLVSRQITTAISSAYSNIERKVGTHAYIEKIQGDRDYADPGKDRTHSALIQSNVLFEKKVPDFFVIIIADIKTGIETRSMLYLQDLRRAHMDHTFFEEYAKRNITKQPSGHSIIIGDSVGEYVDYHDITWNEFLMAQILHRINFQYSVSSQPPKDDKFETFKKIINQTLSAYPHRNYLGVKLNNLRIGKRKTMGLEEIPKFKDYENPDAGRIHNIKVDIAPPAQGGI